MLYFIHGDPNKIFQKGQEMTKSLLKKKPDASIFKINLDNFSEDKIEELIGGQGLFVNKYIVTMSRLLEKEDISKYLINKLSEIENSENIFVWIEEKINKPVLKKIEKHSEKVQTYEIIKKQKPASMNIFDLADAFSSKDKKRVWVLYQKAVREFTPEEIYGTLWWQMKCLLLAQKTNSAEETDLKSYPYQKAKKSLVNFAENSLQETAMSLINVYHQSRMKSEDLSINMERFLLSY